MDRGLSELITQTVSDPIKFLGIVDGLISGVREDNVVVRVGDNIENAIRAGFPGDPERSGDVLSQLGWGVGRGVGILLASLAFSGIGFLFPKFVRPIVAGSAMAAFLIVSWIIVAWEAL